MTTENLKDALPEYAKDLKMNPGSVARTTVLDNEQFVGHAVGQPSAPRNSQVLTEIGAEAADDLSAAAYQAALGAATIIGMNNVFSRGRGFLDGKYDDLHAGLRMNIIGHPRGQGELRAVVVRGVVHQRVLTLRRRARAHAA